MKDMAAGVICAANQTTLDTEHKEKNGEHNEKLSSNCLGHLVWVVLMAYCRWSSLDYGCDIYLYADVNGGYTCHVASKKRVADEPCPAFPTRKQLETMSVEEFRASIQAQKDWADKAELVPIGKEYDGKSFYSYGRDEMVEILKKLKHLGYRMPEWLIDEIANEPDEAK